jgi:hypothetical protein
MVVVLLSYEIKNGFATMPGTACVNPSPKSRFVTQQPNIFLLGWLFWPFVFVPARRITSFVVVCTSAGAKREPLNLVGCHWLVLSTCPKLSPSDELDNT